MSAHASVDMLHTSTAYVTKDVQVELLVTMKPINHVKSQWFGVAAHQLNFLE